MKILQNLSIKNKLVVIILVVSVMTMVAGFGLYTFYDIQYLRKDLENDAQLNARLGSEYCIAPLTFRYQEEVAEVLKKLAAVPSVMAACVYDEYGQPYAVFHRREDQAVPPPPVREDTVEFANEHLHVFHPIFYQNLRYGTIYLKVSTASLNETIKKHLRIMALLMAGLIGLSFFLAHGLQRAISKPILHLADVTRELTEKGDYTLRVKREGSDEIGALYDRFNAMVGQIHQRESERDRAAAALRENEARYRTVVENQTEFIIRWRPDGVRTFANEAYRRYFDLTQEQVLSSGFMGLVAEEDRLAVEEKISRLVSGTVASEIDIHRVLKPDGSIGWQEWIDQAIYDETGRIVEFQSIGRDITERKRAEEQIHYQARLLASVSDAIVASDENHILTAWNAAAEAMYGWKAGEVLGQNGLEVIQTEFAGADKEQMLKAIAAAGQFRGEVTQVRKDGTRFPVEVNSMVLRDEQGKITGFVSANRDISERKRLENAMLQAQKLESLGVLAGGIAHDFNNMLVGILGNAGLALMELPSQSPARETIKQIEIAGQRAAELVRQMLAYSGRGRFVIQPLNLNALIEEMAHLLQVTISKSVILKFNFARDLAAVEADATQIRQVIMNLVVNAAEAIGEKNGVIAITTGAMRVDDEYLAETYPMSDLKPGNFVFLEVADTGCGMDAETQARIFDPFFTTKFTGRGLGLAAVLGIVRGHQGAIKISSTPGRGTTFTVFLPGCQAGAAAAQVEQGLGSSSLFGSGKRVLVIDDDDTVRDVTSRVLEKIGFSVLQAAGGSDGLVTFRSRAHEITCVLLDLTMPNPAGEEVFREIRRLSLDTPVILMSGYNEPEISDRFTGKGLTGFLQKPYRPEELEKLLQKALQRS
jgi:PAS domain S-box-containing protein